MKVFLSPSNQDGNRYAYGNVTEYDVCGDIAKLCKDALARNGIEVMLMHDENIATKVAKANEWGADLYIPIHTNAYNKNVAGTRMFYGSDNGYQACKAIFKYLAPLTPGTSENITKNTSLGEVKGPKATTAYIEVDFHDVESVAKWLIEHKKEIAEAIAHGICDYGKVAYKETAMPSNTSVEKPASKPSNETTVSFKVGDLVSIVGDAKYYTGATVPNWVKNKNWYITEVSGDRIVINKSEDEANSINSPIEAKYLKLVESKSVETKSEEPKSELPYLVQIDINNLNIRKGPGKNYSATGNFTGKGVFTIVEVKKGEGSTTGWGKLKSGAGWISLDFAKRV